jgi:uncharacterized protein YutE (UPF0331/DUF86 family)
MTEFTYAKGRILDSLRFITDELKEFKTDYAGKTWKEYQEDRKLQKLMDRTVENILTALIEVCGTYLNEKGMVVESYGEALRECGRDLGFKEQEQEDLSKLAVQRNRLAHRYMDFRWQAIKTFTDHRDLITRLITLILVKEEEK